MRRAVRLAIPLLAFLVSLPSFASITGTVMNGDGQAIAGAKVSVYAPETIDARRMRAVSATPQRKALASATTDAKGSFRVDVPKEQSAVDLRVDAAGYAPESSWSLGEDDAGAIVLVKAPAKAGRITANGKPVANAAVFWIAANLTDFLAVTDANGHYSVPDPAKWATRVVIVHPDYALLSETMFRDAARMTPDRALNAGVKLTGRVVAEDGSPAAGAELFIDHFSAGKSADDGSFTIAHAKKDWQELEARLGARVAHRVHSDGAVTLKLAKGATLGGTIIDAKSKLPVADAYVTLMAGSGPLAMEMLRGAITDAKGNFSIANVLSGNYTVVTERPGYAVPRAEVALVAGRAMQKPLWATPHARIAGSVVDEEKRPVTAARVTTRPASRGEGMNFAMLGRPALRSNVYSGPDGRFVARDVATESDVIVEAVKKGYPAAHTSALRLMPGEKKSGLTLTIPHGLAFGGRVIDKNGKAVSGATIDVAESRNDAGGPMRRMILAATSRPSDDDVRTASDGTFTVRVKEGRYDVTVKAEGYASKSLRAQNVVAGMKPVDIVVEPGVEITGRVTRGGAGVDNVTVAAISPEGMQSTTTAPDGSFRLGDLTPGQMMLAVNRQDAFIQEMRSVTAPARDVLFDLPPGGRITGHVVDKTTHQPMTSFQAGVSTARSGGGMVIQTPPMLKAFTSDDGAFTLENVRPGPTQVVVNAPGYTEGRVANIEVEDGKTTRDVSVELETGVRLLGKVTAADGTPLAGVTVAPDQSPRAGRVMRLDPGSNAAVTDPNGDYTMEALEPGEKTFVYSRSGYVSEQRAVNLSGKEVRSDVQLSSGLRVAGVVTTESGQPVADGLVRASSASDSTFGREAHSDGNGAFLFEGLAPGHYTFNASRSGYANGISRDVDVTTGAPVRLTMKSGGTISGHVNGLTAEELQQTNVMASSAGGGVVSAPVDAGGNYRIEGAPTGTVRVTARFGAMFAGSTKTSEPKTVVLDPGGSATADLDFKTNTVVRGRITRGGRPMQSAIVMFFPKAGRTQTNASTTADANGHYEISGLDDGPYNVQVVDFGLLAPFATSYEVKGSGTFDIDIKVGTVRGRVLDATNDQPLKEALVELHATSSDSPMNTRAARTDANGIFLLDTVSVGSYQISADKDEFGHEVKILEVQEAGAEVELKLSPSAGVTLRVVDARDGRLIGAVPHVVDMQGHSLDDSGGFGFGGTPEPIKLKLSPGTYRVTLFAQGYASKTITVASPSAQNVPMSPGGTLLIKSKSSEPLRARLVGADGVPYLSGGFLGGGFVTLVPSPGVTTMQNVAPGTFTLQVLDRSDRVVNSTSVTINEGLSTTVEI
jgi:hypothetical protein